MISKTKIAYLRTLHHRKDREQHGRFLIEGKKSILEAIDSDIRIVEGFLCENFLHPLKQTFPVELISEKELARISSLSSNRDGVLVAEIPHRLPPKITGLDMVLSLDGINDPGNLGTIIRIADWYGIRMIIASRDTVDVYNPKTIMASMGSFTRVQVVYTDLEAFFQEHAGMPVYGALLDGENLHTIGTVEPGFILIGSEAHGIRSHLLPWVTRRMTIPRFGGAESLNAGVATGIILDRLLQK